MGQGLKKNLVCILLMSKNVVSPRNTKVLHFILKENKFGTKSNKYFHC